MSQVFSLATDNKYPRPAKHLGDRVWAAAGFNICDVTYQIRTWASCIELRNITDNKVIVTLSGKETCMIEDIIAQCAALYNHCIDVEATKQLEDWHPDLDFWIDLRNFNVL